MFQETILGTNHPFSGAKLLLVLKQGSWQHTLVFFKQLLRRYFESPFTSPEGFLGSIPHHPPSPVTLSAPMLRSAASAARKKRERRKQSTGSTGKRKGYKVQGKSCPENRCFQPKIEVYFPPKWMVYNGKPYQIG